MQRSIDENRAIYFVTKVIHQRVQIFTFDERYPLIVIDNLKFYRKKFGLLLYGLVIMPEHYHLVMEDYRFSSARNYLLEDDSLITLDPLPI